MICPFCKPEILSSVFAESEYFYAIYNIAPVFPGHSLLVSKEHFERFTDIPGQELSELMPFAKKTMEQLTKVFNATDFDIAVQDGFWAGQTIRHFHLHLIPRYENDLPNPGDWYPLFEKNDQKIIDSQSRSMHSVEDISRIVDKLKKS